MTADPDDGAAAVEFALVVTLLIMLLLAIVDYGMWFSDSVGLRQGVREGARTAVVDQFDSGCSGNDAGKTACTTKMRVAALGGEVKTLVRTEEGSWAEGSTLLVCATVKEEGLTNFAPLPEDGILRSKVKMRIEVGRSNSSSVTNERDPSGDNWSWCV